MVGSERARLAPVSLLVRARGLRGRAGRSMDRTSNGADPDLGTRIGPVNGDARRVSGFKGDMVPESEALASGGLPETARIRGGGGDTANDNGE